ncbi:MAG: glycosyltransferase family 2 protein [Sulfolobales archaeon]
MVVENNNLNALITVVIPTLNEVEGVALVIDEILSTGVSNNNILVVDGGSTDGTVDVVMSKGVRIVTQEGKGKAAAIATALKYVNTPYIAVLDSDYTYPAKYIPVLLSEALKGYDLVVGVRNYVKDSQPFIYRLGNTLINKFFNVLFGAKLSDVLSGMYVVRTSRLRELDFEMTGFSVEVELASHIVSTPSKVTEVPIEYRSRLGRKKLHILDGFKIVRDVLRLTWRYNPIFLIFIMGSLLLVPGLLLGAWVAYHYFITGIKYYFRALVAIVLSVAGFQSLVVSLATLYIKRIELRILRKLNEALKER